VTGVAVLHHDGAYKGEFVDMPLFLSFVIGRKYLDKIDAGQRLITSANRQVSAQFLID
jgi:hypothetical protein